MSKKKENTGTVNAVQSREAPKRLYNFPEHGITIEAENREEAEKILQSKLSKK